MSKSTYGTRDATPAQMRDWLKVSDSMFHPDLDETEWDRASDAEVREHYIACITPDPQ